MKRHDGRWTTSHGCAKMRCMNPLDPGDPRRYGDPDLEGRYGQRRLQDYGSRVIWCTAGIIALLVIIAIVAAVL